MPITCNVRKVIEWHNGSLMASNLGGSKRAKFKSSIGQQSFVEVGQTRHNSSRETGLASNAESILTAYPNRDQKKERRLTNGDILFHLPVLMRNYISADIQFSGWCNALFV